MNKKLGLVAISVSLFFAIIFPIFSLTIAHGSWADLITHPHFWLFYLKAASWFFANGLLCIIGSVIFEKLATRN